MWRSLPGYANPDVLGIDLWECLNFVSHAAVERVVKREFRNPVPDPAPARAAAWETFFKLRKNRADILWVHYKRQFQGEWLVDQQKKPGDQKEAPPDLDFEPSITVMSREDLLRISSRSFLQQVHLPAASPYVERLKKERCSKGESAEQWGDRISKVWDALWRCSNEVRALPWRNPEQADDDEAEPEHGDVHQEACAPLFYKNLHLPVEEEDEFLEDKPDASSTKKEVSPEMQMLQQLQQMNLMLIQQQQKQSSP
ncbi:hypothetical protein PI124_g2881 [Phytophthora idaei]|nr:hypothetical protein PI126_g6130 [Phytophthora idaei]KAG3252519.1 hypothetical protein PI124_g2881 [Phytophthora idaei]